MAIDPDGAIVSYAWDFDDGGAGGGIKKSDVMNKNPLTPHYPRRIRVWDVASVATGQGD
jgi:hypothetical protein